MKEALVAGCRVCRAPLQRTFVNLGSSPLANSYLTPAQMHGMEPHFPLHVFVCERCLAVQLEEFEKPEHIFSNYAYFSSVSTSWLDHCRNYAEAMTREWGLGPQSLVLEAASNDGYLLQYFRDLGVPVLGIEPAANVAQTAIDKGIPTRVSFFHAETAKVLVREGIRANLALGNNVLAHVPDIHSFVEGFRIILAPGGVITFEFPHLLNTIRLRQFDTIYHEHFSYLSLHVVERVFREHDLKVFRVETLPTHGGSLRVFGAHAADDAKPEHSSVAEIRKAESDAHLDRLDGYEDFASEVVQIKMDLLEFLIRARREGKRVAGYGAPAKGVTLVNYCGIGPELLPFTVDRSPHKQGLYLPGCRIPILAPEAIDQVKPDYVLILPWNLRDEITTQIAHVRDWGGRFVTPIPKLAVF